MSSTTTPVNDIPMPPAPPGTVPPPTLITDAGDVEVAIFDADGISRNVPGEKVTDFSFDAREAGGLGPAKVSLLGEIRDDVTLIANGDWLKVWVAGKCRFIGQVREVPQNQNGRIEGTANGLMDAMNHVQCGPKIVRVGGWDVAKWGQLLFERFEASRPCPSFLGVYETDFQTCGVAVQELDLPDGSLREAMDKLLSYAPGAFVWGWEVNSATENLRFYVRPRVSVIGHLVAADTVEGLPSVIALAQTDEISDLVNIASPLRGGKATYPNLLGLVCKDASGKPNTAFERPAPPTVTQGNLLSNPGFDDTQTLLGDGGDYQAAKKWEGPEHSGIGEVSGTPKARSGRYARKFDGTDDYWRQDPGDTAQQVVPGLDYVFGGYLRRDAAKILLSDPDSIVAAALTFYNGSGSALGAPVSVTFSPKGTAYEQFRGSATAPAGAVRCGLSFSMTDDDGGTLWLDDAFVWESTGAIQPGWDVDEQDGTLTRIQWQYEAKGFGRGGCVRIDVAEGDVRLRPENDSLTMGLRVPLKGSLDSFAGFFVTSPDDVTTIPECQVRVVGHNSQDNQPGDNAYQLANFDAGPALTDWAFYGLRTSDADALQHLPPAPDIVVHNQGLTDDTETVHIEVYIKSAGSILVGAAMVRDASAGLEFLAGDTWERIVRVDDADLGLTAPVSTSIATYGPHEAVVSNSNLVDWDSYAKQFISAQFKKSAVPVHRPPLTVRPHDPADNSQWITPASAKQIRVVGIDWLWADVWPAKVSYSWSPGGAVSLSIENGELDPTIAKLLADASFGASSRNS